MRCIDVDYVDISNYSVPSAMVDVLKKYATNGYCVTSSIMLPNKYGIDVLRLFFTKFE